MQDVFVALAILCFVALGIWSTYVMAEAYYYQGQLAKDLRRDLGFARTVLRTSAVGGGRVTC